MLKKTEIYFENGNIVKVKTVKRSEPESITEAASETAIVPEEKSIPDYIVGSRFLYDCHNYLMRRPTEMLHDVSGVKHNGFYTLERIEPLNLMKAPPFMQKAI